MNASTGPVKISNFLWARGVVYPGPSGLASGWFRAKTGGLRGVRVYNYQQPLLSAPCAPLLVGPVYNLVANLGAGEDGNGIANYDGDDHHDDRCRV